MVGDTRRVMVACLALLIGASMVWAGAAADRGAITTGSLFEEMVDMTSLAVFPEPAYRTIQFSSFDHRSRVPGGPDWFANSDGFGGEPIPNFEKVLKEPNSEGVGEYLIADVEGPGALVRVWTAAIDGRIKMYIDDMDTPIYEDTANNFFHHPYNHFEQIDEIDRDRFNRTVHQRDASYAPIPFAKRLRVVWTGNVRRIHFYQLQVRLYDKDARVVSFTPKDIHTYRDTIDRVTKVLDDPDEKAVPASNQTASQFAVRLAPDQKEQVAGFEGTMAIGLLKIQLKAEDIDRALRQTVLHITFDNHPWPQVQSPVGDFFGAAPGINPYKSMPFTVEPDGTMTCRYVMPFQKTCKVELINHGGQAVQANGSILPIPLPWNDRTMHFRALWRTDHDLIASGRHAQDLAFILAHGKGVYVGTTSYLLNPSDVPTPYGNWWGEGDEKIFVDDDVEPSTFGTGSEDYYNYSWSSPDIFIFPYCGQPRNDGPGNRGFVTNYRYHILDALPFKKRMDFYMELYSHETLGGVSYARIGYHYARPGVTDDHLAITTEDVRHLVLPEAWQPAARMGANNSVFFTAEDTVTDAARTYLRSERIWAGGKLMVWNPEKVGDRKSFKLSVEAAGNKQVQVVFGLTPKSGQVTMLLDGKPLGPKTIDLYRPYRTLSRRYALPTSELTAGDHTLTLKYKGAGDGTTDAEIGVDFIYIQNR